MYQVHDLDLEGYEVDAAGTFVGHPPTPTKAGTSRSESMGFIASNKGGDFKAVPPGNYIARCFRLVDLGHQTNEKFGNSTHKIRIDWEVFGEDDVSGAPLTVERDGKAMPMTIGADYTVSLNEKATLRKVLAAWRGRNFSADELKAFDISKLLGAYCLLNVTTSESSNGKTYSNVSSVAPLPKAMAASKPAGVHPLTKFDIDNPDMDIFNELPKFLQDRIKAAPEWAATPAKAPKQEQFAEDDIPF